MTERHSQKTEHTQSQFALKRATLPDFDTIAMLFEALHTYNASLDSEFALRDGWHDLLCKEFVRTYNDAYHLWLLAWDNTYPAGLMKLAVHRDESAFYRQRRWAELVALYVDPAYRRMALASQFIQAACTWTAAHGIRQLQLYVTATNERARQFYHRNGFHPAQEIWRMDVTNTASDHANLTLPYTMSTSTSDNGSGSGLTH